MIGTKVVLTYKRKRLSSRPGLGFESERRDQTLEVLKGSVNEEEVSTHESERRDPETFNQCALYNGNSNVLQKCESDKDLDGCSSCVKQKDRLSTFGHSCDDAMKVKTPFITFSRRSRQKKTAMQEKSSFVEKYYLVAVKRCNSTSDDGCLLDLSTASPGYCTATQETKTIEDIGSLSVPKIEIDKLTKEELSTGSCILKDTPPIAESSEGFMLQKSPMDYVKDKSLETSQSLVIASDESRIISSDDVESAKITIHKKRDEGSFDLSKPPPELSGLVDCNITLESSSSLLENNRESTDSTSRSHLHDFPSRSRALELLDERIGEISLSHAHCVPPKLSSSTHMSVSIAQTQASNKNFLQLFPEDTVNDNRHPQSNRKPLLFRTSLRIESRNSAIQDMLGAQYPSDSVSLMRHKMMLDSILSKARAARVINRDHPNVWSEDELDFLWIGVRRHGMGSWDAILRDPRLHFSSWRSPRELAERWEEEQSNLLRNTKQFTPTDKHNPPILVEDPQLSLRYRGRSTVDPLLVKRNSNIPHWLREAVSFPPSRPVVEHVSYTGHSGLMQWINQPFCRTVGMTDKIGPELHPTSGANHWAVQAVATHPVSKQDEVIVIESDASSEETISDDHSVRS